MDMLHGPIWSKIPRFALPIAAPAILGQLFNAADIAVVGNFTAELRTASERQKSSIPYPRFRNILLNSSSGSIYPQSFPPRCMFPILFRLTIKLRLGAPMLYIGWPSPCSMTGPGPAARAPSASRVCKVQGMAAPPPGFIVGLFYSRSSITTWSVSPSFFPSCSRMDLSTPII